MLVTVLNTELGTGNKTDKIPALFLTHAKHCVFTCNSQCLAQCPMARCTFSKSELDEQHFKGSAVLSPFDHWGDWVLKRFLDHSHTALNGSASYWTQVSVLSSPGYALWPGLPPGWRTVCTCTHTLTVLCRASFGFSYTFRCLSWDAIKSSLRSFKASVIRYCSCGLG